MADLKPESTSLEEAAASADFELLTPLEIPDGATLVDVLEVKGIVELQARSWNLRMETKCC